MSEATVQALETITAAQATHVAETDARVTILKEAVEVKAREEVLPWTIFAAVLGGAGFLIGSYSFLDFRQRAKELREETQRYRDEELKTLREEGVQKIEDAGKKAITAIN